MKLQLQGSRLIVNIAMVLGALYLPFVSWAATERIAGVGIVSFYLPFGLWFLATIGLGLRFGTWWALLLGVFAGPFGLLSAGIITGNAGDMFELREGGVEIWTMVSLTWLVGLAVGVLIRKAIFWRSQLFP